MGTRAVRAGQATDPQTGAHATPMHQTSTFVLGDVERSRRLFDGEEAGFVYSRAGNPTVKAVEEKLAALEGAETAVAFASGMGAASATMLSLLRQGDEVLFLGPLYGGTRALLEDLLPRFGITGRRVEDATLASSVGANSRMMHIETPTNPTLAIHDLENASRVAKAHGMVSVVDNTFATPILTRPIEHGIDLVLHSATKYLGGHGDLLGGVVAGNAESIGEIRAEGLRHIGAVLDPHPAFLMLRACAPFTCACRATARTRAPWRTR